MLIRPNLKIDLAALAALAALSAGCASPQRAPEPPAPPPEVAELVDDGLTIRLQDGPPALQPYLEKYPLGNRGRRKDLLAADNKRSMHLVQLSLPLPEHTHPGRTETTYVLRGTGRVQIGDRGYPATPGAAFRVEAGIAHSVLPDEGETLIAIVYYDPPLLDNDGPINNDATGE